MTRAPETESAQAPRSAPTRDHAERRGARCERCKETIDLTTTLLLKNGRIVGCPRCDWGSSLST